MRLVPRRRSEPEWMDRPGNDAADLRGALRDIAAVNRLLGGRRVLLDALDPFLDAASAERPFSILDVGSGGGDLAVAMVHHARLRGRLVNVVAVDIDPVAAVFAAEACAAYGEIRVIRGDAFRLPFRDGSFDLVTASLFLHHFSHRDAAALLASFHRLARRGVLVNDLRRHVVPWAFIALAARTASRHPMFVHDAPLSVLRGFTAEELLDAGRRAAGSGALLRRRWPFRLVLTLPAAAATP